MPGIVEGACMPMWRLQFCVCVSEAPGEEVGPPPPLE